MKNIEKEFVPYDIALELKQLKFDEPCLASYYHAGRRLDICEYINHGEYTVLAPTYSQAFRWFREKHGSFLFSDYGKFPHITIIQNLMFENPNIIYEEAELDCLRELIKIVKEEKA